MWHSDTGQRRWGIVFLSAVESHPYADEIHTTIHLRAKVLGLCDCGILDPGHSLLLLVVEL